jgi:hypothetical protein
MKEGEIDNIINTFEAKKENILKNMTGVIYEKYSNN